MSSSDQQKGIMDTNKQNENTVSSHPKTESSPIKDLVSIQNHSSVEKTALGLVEKAVNDAKTAPNNPIITTTEVEDHINEDSNVELDMTDQKSKFNYTDAKLQDDNIADLPSDDIPLTWQNDVNTNTKSSDDLVTNSLHEYIALTRQDNVNTHSESPVDVQSEVIPITLKNNVNTETTKSTKGHISNVQSKDIALMSQDNLNANSESTVDTNVQSEDMVLTRHDKSSIKDANSNAQLGNISWMWQDDVNTDSASTEDDTINKNPNNIELSYEDNINTDSGSLVVTDVQSENMILASQDKISVGKKSEDDIINAQYEDIALTLKDVINTDPSSPVDGNSDTKPENSSLPVLIVDTQPIIDNENFIKDSEDKIIDTDFEETAQNRNTVDNVTETEHIVSKIDSEVTDVDKNIIKDQTTVRHKDIAETSLLNSNNKDLRKELIQATHDFVQETNENKEVEKSIEVVVEHIDIGNKDNQKHLIVETDLEMTENVQKGEEIQLVSIFEEKSEISKENDDVKHTKNVSVEKYLMQINTEHGLKKPDMMIHIPSQDLDANFMDTTDLDSSAESIDTDLTKGDTTNLGTMSPVKRIEKSDTINASDKIVEEDSQLISKEISQSNIDDINEIGYGDFSKKFTDSTKPEVLDSVLHSQDNKVDIEIDQAEIKTSENILESPTNISVTKDVPVPKESTLDIDKPEFQPILDIKEVPELIVSATKPPLESMDMHDAETEVQDAKQASDIMKKTADLLDAKTAVDIKEVVTPKKNLHDNQIELPDSAVKGHIEFATSVEDSKELQNMPSTSCPMDQDSTDEVPEVEDSLGLLAETFRVMEDDDDQDQEDDEDDDDDGDFDQDDESNQMTAEHSEDSNAPQSESDLHKEQQDDSESCQDYPKGDQIDFEINEGLNEADKDELMDIEENELNVESQVTSEDTNEVDIGTESDITIDEPTIQRNLGDKIVETDQTDDQSDIETVKLSDTSDTEIDLRQRTEKNKSSPLLRNLLEKEESEIAAAVESSKEKDKQSPSKTKKLEIAKRHHVLNIVDLEESSSEDDVQEVDKTPKETPVETSHPPEAVTSLHIPNEIDVMCTSAGNATSEIVTREGEVVISGVPVPKTPHKKARLNTGEVTIKTANTSSESTLVIPETKIADQTKTASPKESLEVFSLDSDEEDPSAKIDDDNLQDTKVAEEKPRELTKCINSACAGNCKSFIRADPTTVLFYDSRKKKPMVCEECWDVVARKKQTLVEDFKSLQPLLTLDMGKVSQQLVEISDSDSDDGSSDAPLECCGDTAAKFLEDNLAEMLNETWVKFNMDERLKDTQKVFTAELDLLEKESAEIDNMLKECQVDTDKLRSDFYKTFEPKRKELPPLLIYDTPDSKYVGPEATYLELEDRKRRLSSASEIPAKKPAIPLGNVPSATETQSPQEQKAKEVKDTKEDDDNVDVSVVELSKESAPSDLPPPGELSRAPLRVGNSVYAMRTAFGSWLQAKIVEVHPRSSSAQSQFTMCRVKFEGKGPIRMLPARCLAYDAPADVRMTIGTRVVALFKDPNSPLKRELYYSGVVAEVPNPVNTYRYLVFFDDGYAQYVSHSYTRLVCECSPCVWEEVHPYSRQFVREYLLAYPERPMVRLHNGQSLKTEWNGKWWMSRVLNVDASLVQVYFEEDNRTEWIYRGSTRLAPLFLELQAAERHRNRPMPRSNKVHSRMNMPYVEYTRSDEQKQNEGQTQQGEQQSEEMRRQRAVAKKSTTAPAPLPPPPSSVQESFTSRVVYYTPKNAIKPFKMSSHTCGPKCKRTDVLSLEDLRTYNPLTKPLLSGWERQIIRYKNHKEVMYRSPCGRRIRNMAELHRYLVAVQADMAVDLFDFCANTHCLAEFVLNRCRVSKKDLSHGKENIPVPCVNYYDDSLPEFCSYNTERIPTAGVPLNLDPDFLCGCDCTDDCVDKTKCACWKMTLEGARTIGIEGPDIGYVYKRLPEPIPSGIYECNSRCKCKHTCLNRVAQHPLQLKLQVFKTLNRGWGIRALNDVPKGAFLCVYAGNLLTDATANLDGLNEGDEYLAELDYIEVVEQMKEGFEDDIPDPDKELDGKVMKKELSEEEELSSSSDEEETSSKADRSDDEFRPAYDVAWTTAFKKNLRRRDKAKKDKDKTEEENKEREKEKERDPNAEEDCITISDDEEAIREPSRFSAQATMASGEFVSKYRSLRAYFGKDEACYIMDAKVQGNIGRYLNHSCSPNVFVQNVFVDTHDPRFPWVAFFALSHIRAGTELTWNYNYDVGSVPGKVLYCYCGAINCRGRLL